MNTIENLIGLNLPPWRSSTTFRKVPRNVVTNKFYGWKNASRLLSAGFIGGYWGTKKAWAKKGFEVLRENHHSIIDCGRKIKLYNQCATEYNDESNFNIDRFVDLVNKSVNVVYGMPAPLYRISKDLIEMPSRESYSNQISFVKVILHEICHWTAKRLNRPITGDKSSPTYANEELIAELTSLYVCNIMKIEGPDDENHLIRHASYIREWFRLSNTSLQEASQKAKKASDFIVCLLNGQ